MSGVRDLKGSSRVLTVRDPLAAWSALASRYGRDDVVLLESASGEAEDAQFSFLGFGRIATLSIAGDAIDLSAQPEVRDQILARIPNAPDTTANERFWSAVESFLTQFATHDHPNVFAFLSYDCGRRIELMPEVIDQFEDSIPEISLVCFQGCLTVPFGSDQATVTLYDGGVRSAIDELVGWLQRSQLSPVVSPASVPKSVTDDTDQKQFEELVESCRRLIAAGDIYQVQIGHTVTVHSDDLPEEVYHRLREENPSPYMYLATVAGHNLIGSSPELLVRSAHGSVVARPLAGTISRQVGEEAKQRAALLGNPKERAEHTMLVDLCRNDIGRVVKPGTLKVPVDMTVVDLPSVHHLASTVAGELAPETSVTDVLKAVFPAGTMTGAPKVRAMEVIEEHEFTRRGAYAGAIGLVGAGGRIDMALCIRAIVRRPDNSYSMRASAGVVADSDSEGEWAETLAKLSAPFHALTGRRL